MKYRRGKRLAAILTAAAVLTAFVLGGCRDAVDTGVSVETAEAAAVTQWETTVAVEEATETTETTKVSAAVYTDPSITQKEETRPPSIKTTRRTTTTARPLDGRRLQVPYISQKGILPNGCEAVSATMVLQYWGYSLTAEDFVDRYLDCVTMDFSKTPWRGPDPNEAYAGDPRSQQNGIGCFAPAIVRAMERVIGEDHQVKNLTGLSLEQLCRDYIDQGIPVAVWATVNMRSITKYHRWQSFDGTETYTYPSGEHCLVLVGYDDTRYYFNDPYDGKGLTAYSRSTVQARYEALGKQAVAVLPVSPSTAAPTTTSSPAEDCTTAPSSGQTDTTTAAETTTTASQSESSTDPGTEASQTTTTWTVEAGGTEFPGIL